MAVLLDFVSFSRLMNLNMDIAIHIRRLHRFYDSHKLEFYQCFYWVFYFLFTMVQNAQMEEPYPWWLALLSGLLVIGIVYTVVYIFTRVYLRPLRGTLVIALAFVLYSLLYYSLIYHLLPWMGFVAYNQAEVFSWAIFFFGMFLYFQHAMVEAGLLSALYRVRRQAKKEKKLLKAKHRAKIKFLLGQMEPHEEYNSLNIPYAMALEKGDEELAEALLEQQQYMQYIQEQAKRFSTKGLVPIEEELQHGDRIIAINKRRFERIYVLKDIPACLQDWKVPGLSISALLKNAFKFGIFWEPGCPLSLHVACSATQLVVTIRNKINPEKGGFPSTGIGNKNIRKRLKMLYGDRAKLKTKKKDGWYVARLTITKTTPNG